MSAHAPSNRLVLNADDFGFSDETVQATIGCFARGALTSATIMARMPATASAVAYAKEHPEFSFGAHLTYVGDGVERPVSDPRSVPSLVDEQGRFLRTDRNARAAFFGRIPVDQIRTETEAQLGFLRDHGVRISHVDSHGHIHKQPPFVRALRDVLPRFGIERVRRGQNVWIRRPLRSPAYWVKGALFPPIGRYFRTTERMFMPTCVSDVMSMEAVALAVRGPSLEIGVHPGVSEEWRRLEAEIAGRIADAAPRRGWTLCTWNDV